MEGICTWLTGKLSGVIFPNFRIVDRLPERDSWKVQGYGLDLVLRMTLQHL